MGDGQPPAVPGADVDGVTTATLGSAAVRSER